MTATPARLPLVVLGAGPGGYAAAFHAADLGLPATLIDPEPDPGGVCLYRGCIPSKALLHAAEVIRAARRAESWGIAFAPPRIDAERLRAWKDGVVGQLTGGLGQLRRGRQVEHIRGTARLLDARSLEVDLAQGGRRTLHFEQAIIATGSSAVMPREWRQSPRIWDSTAALALPSVPERLLVVGGGYIGLELGSVYAALGSRVTVVEALDRLLAEVDRDLVRPLERVLAGELEEVLLSTRVAGIEEDGAGIRARLEGKDGAFERAFDRVLVAIGRRPRSDGLGLEHTAATLDEQGFIRVDAQMRTAEPSIFAIGDVVGQPMLAHKAAHEARVAALVAAGRKAAFEPAAIPAVVFTDPEIAWCGLTEEQARRQGIAVTIARFPWAASGRAATLGRGEGLTKLVIDPSSERIRGVGIVGAGAGELIGEGTLAVEMAAVASDVGLTVHAHPTLAETLMEAADAFHGQSTHVLRAKRG